MFQPVISLKIFSGNTLETPPKIVTGIIPECFERLSKDAFEDFFYYFFPGMSPENIKDLVSGIVEKCRRYSRRKS